VLSDTDPTPEPRIRLILVAAIDQGEQLIRADQDDDDIIQLAADIASHGLLQPIGVRPLDGGRYQLLYGARRWLAHQRLRRLQIRATIHTDQLGSVRAIAARENLMRRNLTLTEETDVVRQMHHEERLSPEQVASALSRSRSWVLRRLAVDSLPCDLREPLLSGDLPLGHAEELAQIADPAIRAYALNQVTSARANLTDCRALVAAFLTSETMAAAVAAGIQAAANPAALAPILMRCAMCGDPRELNDLRVIRVCHPHCAETAAPEQERSADG